MVTYFFKLITVVVIYKGFTLGEQLNKRRNNGELMEILFDGYSRSMLPVADVRQPVLLRLGMNLVSIDNVDMKHKTVTARLIIPLAWSDEYLTWNTSHFNHVSRISMESKSIWLPDLIVGNNEEMFTFIGQDDIRNAVIYSDGTVNAWPYLTIEIGIHIDLYKYPFDKQVVVFEFSSWTHSDHEMDIVHLHNDIEDYNSLQFYKKSGEWDLIGCTRSRLSSSYDNLNNVTIIQYNITIQRKWLYTIVNFMIPVMLTSFLNTLSFMLPVDSGERISLSNTVFLTMAVFFTIVNDSLPKTSDGMSIIVVYIGLQMFGSAVTIMATICSLSLYHRQKDIKTSCLANVVLNIGKRNMDTVVAEYADKAHDTDVDISGAVRRSAEETKNKVTWTSLSNYLDYVCFCLSFVWNLVLLLMVIIEANTA